MDLCDYTDFDWRVVKGYFCRDAIRRVSRQTGPLDIHCQLLADLWALPAARAIRSYCSRP